MAKNVRENQAGEGPASTNKLLGVMIALLIRLLLVLRSLFEVRPT